MADCGIVGIFAKDHENVYEKLVHSLHVLQHRGEDACGILVYNNGETHLERKEGLVSSNFHFTEEAYMYGDRGIGHTRYPTTNLDNGCSSCDIQPIEICYDWIRFHIAHNGTITSLCGIPLSNKGKDDKYLDMARDCHSFEGKTLTIEEAKILIDKVREEMDGGTDTEMVGRIIAHLSKNMDFEDAVKLVIPGLTGSFALIMQVDGKIIGIRDPYGIRPLVFGRLPDGYVLASESCVLNELRKLYYMGERIPKNDVKPGNGIILSDDGVKVMRFAESQRTAFCIFEDAYFSRPDSKIRGQILSSFRQRCGEKLGERLKSEFTLKDAEESIIIPIPDGGIPFAVGLSKTTKIPLMSHGLIRDKYTGRTFIRAEDTKGLNRADLVLRKLSFLHDVIEDKVVILADDSIVRGTTTKKVSFMAAEAGAKDVIWCFNFPPISYTCPLGIEMFKGGRDQFIANQIVDKDKHYKIEAGIAEILRVKSAYYMTIDDYLEQLGLTFGEACTGCISGVYPFDELNELYGCKSDQ
ncbi:hypothetical protein GF312_06665 [Candidatus Poribacteria bacterium]|nr:hypothetical protein [Candidatus Poribacteria bacterium]